jgi:transcriptional regulator with XRE-family HTH domain
MRRRGAPKGLLAERLDTLLTHVTGADGTLYTLEGLVTELEKRGVEPSRHYIGALRRGDKNNPTVGVLAAIADVFGVPIDVFTNRDSPAWAQLERVFEHNNQALDPDQVRAEVAHAGAINALPDDVQVFLRGYEQLDHADRSVAASLIASLLNRERHDSAFEGPDRRSDPAQPNPD